MHETNEKAHQDDLDLSLSRQVPARSDSALEAEGWERRFVADAQRATEVVDLYRQLGFEVLTESVKPGSEINPDCEDCALVAQLKYKTIYTRRPLPSPLNNDKG